MAADHPFSLVREPLTSEKPQCDQRPMGSRGSPVNSSWAPPGASDVNVCNSGGGSFGGEFPLPLLSGVRRSGSLLCADQGWGSQGRAGAWGKQQG